MTAENTNNHAEIKKRPPIGVSIPIGPKLCPPILNSDMAYNEPLNSAIPIIKQVDAHFRLRVGNCRYSIPVTNKAKL